MSSVPASLSDLKGLQTVDGRYYANIWIPEQKKTRRIKLTRIEEGDKACRDAYRDLVVGTRTGTVATLLHDYVSYEERRTAKNPKSKDVLSQATIDNYWDRLSGRPVYEHPDTGKSFIAGLIPQFGDMPIQTLKHKHVREYLAIGKAVGRPVSANRDKSLLSSAYEYALSRASMYPQLDDDFLNPCLGIRRNDEHPSRSYAEDHEVEEFLPYCNRALQFLVRGAWLSGIRFTDLALLEDKHLKYRPDRNDPKKGMKWFLDWTESKTGKNNGLEVGPGLMKVIREAQAFRKERAARITIKLKAPRPEPPYIFTSMRDQQWTADAMSNAWGDARETAMEDGMKVHFSFRTMRAKAQTDADHNVIGHVGQMRERYTRRRALKSVA